MSSLVLGVAEVEVRSAKGKIWQEIEGSMNGV